MTQNIEKEFVQILKRCEVFMGLLDNGLIKIASLPSIHYRTFDADEVISNVGEPAENMYILVEGQVDLRLKIEHIMDSQTEGIKVDTVSKGSIFGWSALVQPYTYSRMAVCSMKSKVLVINGKELIRLMDDDEHMGYEIMRSIACVIASRLKTPNHYFWAELLKALNGIDR